MINYIKEMREMIGNKPLLLVGTSVIAVKDDMILLQKRADSGLWGYPGGYMEVGETTEESAKRERYEETGLIALDLKLYGVFSGEKRHYVYPNGHEVYITDVVYTCHDYIQSDKSHDNEVIEIKWFPFSDIPQELSPPVKDIIEKFVSDFIN
jgi:ADP-ribose pyrophosphatase YjhB (NUDIX family)